jgi:class 3 adenylate cyclase
MGVRERLLLAFLGISAFAVVAAVAALVAFAKLGAVLDRVVEQRVPNSFAALELSRQAERIAAAAPSLLAGTNTQQRMRTDQQIRRALIELDRLYLEVAAGSPSRDSLIEIETSVAAIRANIKEIQSLLDPWKSLPGSRPAQAEALLRNNSRASARLADAVDLLIEEQRLAIHAARADVVGTQRLSTGILGGVIVLSLATSGLIVWLYVHRSLIRRLRALSASTLALASGKLDTPLPTDKGSDEIRRMGDALRIFRDTAIEKSRVERLKRFLAPQIAELIVSTGDEALLDSHRREIAVLFCDLRGFTTFAETAEPEEVVNLLREYQSCLGTLVHKFGGTLERFTGDGLIALFNDPLPCPEPCLSAARLAVEMRVAVGALASGWRKLDSRLGFGIGISYGYATLGRVGFEGRYEYTAIGTVVNLAARLCERAQAGEILVDAKVQAALAGALKTEAAGEFLPKGFSRPVHVFNIPAVPAGSKPDS